MSFIHDNFLLKSSFAERLYHDHAKNLPIIDYHCHLSPLAIAENRQFTNLTNAWLDGDHYKWRAMRTLGIAESYITGKASDAEKFAHWSYTVPFTVRNPLYHWSHLELSRYFNINLLLTPETATHVYNQANDLLAQPDYTTRGLLTRMHVEVVCSTDDPIDSLDAHQQLAQASFDTRVLPTFRPDKAYAVENPTAYRAYLDQLAQASGITITHYASLLEALDSRIEFFHARGCRLADHGLEQITFPADGQLCDPEKLFARLLQGQSLTPPEIHAFRYALLLELGKRYHRRGWTQQFHLGALRNTNSRMMQTLGPDTGFDSIGDFPQSVNLARFLNELDRTNQLAKTILYNLNPADNEVMATMIGNFNDGSVKGKIQFGSAWWFLDQKDGMEKQLNALSNLGMLSCFIGMLTDSRSFLSYPRHEYFRRILCNLLAQDVVNGELPADEQWLGKIVRDICYHNAQQYFNF